MDHVGNADPARFRDGFETGGNVDPVAVNVLALDDNVTEMDADAEQQLSVFGRVAFSPRGGALDVYGALDRIDDTAELDQEPIAHGFDHPPPVFADGRVNNLAELIVEPGARPSFICAHETAVTNHVGS
jgi:hypothetical protein